MTLPLSHQNGASAHHPFDISKNQATKRSKNTGLQSVGKAPLFETHERFRAAFNIGSSAKVIVTHDMKVFEANKLFSTWFADSLPAHITGLGLGELNIFTSSTINELHRRIQTVPAEKNGECLADISVNRDQKNLQISVWPIAAKNKNVSSQLMIDIADVTELEHNKSRLSDSRLQLRLQENEFRKVAKVVSHDLRAPSINLSNLIGILENTENSVIDPEVLSGLKTSVKSILETLENTGAELNKNLLQTADNHAAPIGDNVKKILENIRHEKTAVGAKINFETYDTSDWEIEEELLKMVLSQLISNSIRFCHKDKDPIINISAFKQGGNRIISVADNGVGIDLKGQEQRLFGLFQTFHTHPEARGVGLFQVKNRMKSIGGDVVLESEVGVGTTVRLNFN